MVFFSLVSQKIDFLSSMKNRQIALMQDLHPVQILYKKLKQRKLNKNTCFLKAETTCQKL